MPYEFPSPFPCSFCEYIAGRLPWDILEFQEDAVAFLNPRQRSRGAVLVAPRRHVETLSRLRAEESRAVMSLVQRMSRAISEVFSPDGLHVFCNAGRLAGQSEAHVHVQIIPRYEGIPYNFAASAEHALVSARDRHDLAELLRRASRSGGPVPR